jgi:DNA-binding response OmpR family regulator
MAGYNLEELNFLVIDDNKHMRALVKTILYSLGARKVLEAGDGADAFKELRSFPADIIICDWNMSPLDGMDFVRMVRTAGDSPNPFAAIIMMTGHTELHRVLEARDAGVHEFLAKPISAKSLYTRVRAIIEKPRPFIRIAHYFGPDRRRRAMDFNKERRKVQAKVIEAESRKASSGVGDADKETGMSQDDINALLAGM